MGNLSYTTSQVDNKLTGSFGELHLHDNITLQAIANGTTYIKFDGFMDVNSQNVTVSAVNNNMTIVKAGTYLVICSFSMITDTNNIILYAGVFLNDVEYDNIHFSRKIGTGTDVGAASATGILTLAADDVVDFRFRHSGVSSVDLTVSYGNMSLVRIDI